MQHVKTLLTFHCVTELVHRLPTDRYTLPGCKPEDVATHSLFINGILYTEHGGDSNTPMPQEIRHNKKESFYLCAP